MTKLKRILTVVAVVILSGCASEPRVRDTSHDDPRKLAEIERLVSRTGSSSVLGAESKFRPRENMGWTTYKLYDKETMTTSALQIQIIPAGPGKHWLETRVVGPSEIAVSRMLIGTSGKPLGKTADGKTINKKLLRMIIWNSNEKNATEFPPDFIQSSNHMAGNLMAFTTTAVTPEMPKKRVKVPAGTFPSCFVHTVDKILFLREAEESCYSGLIPAPHLVVSESESSKQELVSYGFDTRRSLLPSNVKVVVDDSMKSPKIADRSEEIRNLKNKKKSAKTADNKDNLLNKILGL